MLLGLVPLQPGADLGTQTEHQRTPSTKNDKLTEDVDEWVTVVEGFRMKGQMAVRKDLEDVQRHMADHQQHAKDAAPEGWNNQVLG